MRLFPVLLWILFPGCQAVLVVTGPRAVRGQPGGLVTVRCQYNRGFEALPKFWCGGRTWHCSNGRIVETTGSQAVVKQGRVSIRDNHTQRVFTVTMENLTLADAGTYQCGVLKTGHPDPRNSVKVIVSSGLTKQPDAPSSLNTDLNFSPTTVINDTRFIILFLLLLLLKGLIFLSIIGATIWVSMLYQSSCREMKPDGQAH
uniref:CMRF35-like molecule 3 n=1 Tax=Pelodiscus sinensis TaxID=13735 RepID=K7G5J6_PELSI|nr:CMRF35-like molecule 3 [Pelodiscus sinensis]|eukprot:XP_006134410.1 CMRF35-like molecule 3 [Pelodiscus sinensis]